MLVVSVMGGPFLLLWHPSFVAWPSDCGLVLLLLVWEGDSMPCSQSKGLSEGKSLRAHSWRMSRKLQVAVRWALQVCL